MTRSSSPFGLLLWLCPTLSGATLERAKADEPSPRVLAAEHFDAGVRAYEQGDAQVAFLLGGGAAIRTCGRL
jgi:hypothetical protein